ncbi:TPA: acetyl-CoA carboxylase carboxyltransferase subunit alpha [Candidatus Galligastranaerophilus intestinavium]|uniref:Acetyl-coenzyme A carboxylase carboxyl transferase subunit alpha n=1 Tax=Candidatus Galligastranaerophilus intestinavium TaxID=2840836 RepID=A0A9D1JY78_9BACT|nr:acetyl-CoA carboxylase carboxyltransferase subunit alpha [Candidatus Galligastranaerophilus intestinavium]
MQILEFEKPIYKMEEKIEELKKLSADTNMDYNDEIKKLENQTEEYKKELYESLEPYQKLQIARHPQRPNFLDYVHFMCEDFIEFHGDREGCDDRAIIGGIAKIDGRSVMLVGTQKGKTTKENLEYNFGMPQPQGYRKALRLFEHASKFNLPIITLVDTMGAYPGMQAEQTGQGIAIAVNLREMAKLEVPVIAVITGEGCSGGALGLAVANKVMILEHAYYTVISPEGCASILWRDANMAREAANALKITGKDLLQYGIVDEVIKEPVGGAHYNPEAMACELKKSLLNALDEYKNMSAQELKDDRYNKFRHMGVFAQ